MALDSYRQALQISVTARDRNGEANTLSNLGRLHESAGDKQLALDYFRQALSIHSVVGNRNGEATSRYEIARVESAGGNLDGARAQIEMSLGIVESLRTKITRDELRASYFASARSYYELYVDLLMKYHQQRPREGFDAAALEASERARARNLLELLTEAHADIRQGVAPELLDRERALQLLLNAKAERQMRLLGGKHTEEQAKASAKEIEAITSEYQEVRAQIRSTSPRYASLTQPASLSSKEVQSQVLDLNTLLLEYSLGNERSFLWAVTPTSVDSYELPKRAEVEALARGVYDSLTVRNRRRPDETTQQWLARNGELMESKRRGHSRVNGALLPGDAGGR